MENLTNILIAIIVSLPAFLAWKSSRKNSAAIQEVHILINSRMTELLEATKAESKAEGREIGRNEEPDKIPK